MDLLANDLSIHMQFHDLSSFRSALERLMVMRKTARRFGREVSCHRALLTIAPMPDMTMQQALGHLTVNEKRSVLSWLMRRGPFWDDIRQHGADDWLECQGDIVTDSAVGEAAFRTLHGVACCLVSAVPSDWDYSPVAVTWRRKSDGLEEQHTIVDNWRDVVTLEENLRDAAPPIRSWNELRKTSTSRFTSLIFAQDCFNPLLEGVPFAKSAAKSFLWLLDILDRFACAFDANGGRTPEGQRIYQDYFTGGTNATFSDSSTTDKMAFPNELTFPHPEDPRRGFDLYMARQGESHDTPPALLMAHPVGRARLRCICRPKDRQGVKTNNDGDDFSALRHLTASQLFVTAWDSASIRSPNPASRQIQFAFRLVRA